MQGAFLGVVENVQHHFAQPFHQVAYVLIAVFDAFLVILFYAGTQPVYTAVKGGEQALDAMRRGAEQKSQI